MRDGAEPKLWCPMPVAEMMSQSRLELPLELRGLHDQLIAYLFSIESTDGAIDGFSKWSNAKWSRALGAGATSGKIRKLSDAGLVEVDEARDRLVARFYPSWGIERLRASREKGAKAAKARWVKHAASTTRTNAASPAGSSTESESESEREGDLPRDGADRPEGRMDPDPAPQSAAASKASERSAREPSPHPGFEDFWAAYPKKVAKISAQKAWNKQRPPLPAVLATLAWQRLLPDWTKDGGEYIPHPASWLNDGRWADEKPAKSNGFRFSRPEDYR